MSTLTCDVLVVGGFVLANVGQQASGSGSLVSSHAFWYGILLACLIGWILPDWALIILFVVALFASDLFQSTVGHAHTTSWGVLVVILVGGGLLVGLWFGRRRGLLHLGEAEFGTRWGNVLKIHRWF